MVGGCLGVARSRRSQRRNIFSGGSVRSHGNDQIGFSGRPSPHQTTPNLLITQSGREVPSIRALQPASPRSSKRALLADLEDDDSVS